jgi:hypothetical protein
MHASAHDRIIVLSPRLDEPNRDGEILEVRGSDGAPPYRVRWSDTGHEGLYFPGTDAVIHHPGGEPVVVASDDPAALRAGDALSSLLSLDVADIAALRWEAVDLCPGVQQKVLWRLGDFVQALLRYAPSASTPGIAHLAAHHHIWVVSGTVTIAGRLLGAGSYMHVPPEVAHPATSGPDGCTILQMHRPHPPN